MSSQRAINGGRDKYYTKPHLADYCSHLVLERYGPKGRFIVPCAGSGAFLGVLPWADASDIEPEDPRIRKADVFDLKFTSEDIVVSNLPFGTNASLAVRVFNHCASYEVKALCIIVPRTFRKDSLKAKLNRKYHLVFEFITPKDSFLLEGAEYHVPCVFQVWERRTKDRPLPNVVACPWITFVDKAFAKANPASCVAMRRAGGRAGQVLEGLEHAEVSTYFIEAKDQRAMDALRLIRYDRYVDETAGVKSISQNEVRTEVARIMGILNVPREA